jgi:enoyl-CoA hydratase/carnithine racemase
VSDEILVERHGPIATVVFNRPQVRNAFNLAMWSALPGVVEGLVRDPGVRAIVFRGAGEEAFASGADISEFRENRKDRASAEAYNARTAAAAHAMETCPKPTVAMIHGYCMGGAVATALACDLRFSADTGKFGIPAGRLGIIYGLHAVKRLVSLVGPATAKDILFSARLLDAQEALRVGFVQRVVPAAELSAYTYDYLGRVADNAPLTVQGAKVIVEAIVEDGGVAKQDDIAHLQLRAFESEDYKEGTAAFLEKRRPRFVGR